MKLSSLILTHANPNLTNDTVDSIRTWVGDNILVLVDQVGWSQFQHVQFGTAKIEQGFLHANNRSPYRNYALGLKKLYEYWPDSDWFLYSEYDCLFTSDAFQEDLEQANNKNAWMAGIDARRFDFCVPLLEQILNQGSIKNNYYLLGCCQFLHNKLVSKLYEMRFFDNLICNTRSFPKGFFPGYERWAFEEELWPTLSVHLGGALYELVCWKGGSDWQENIDPNILYSDQGNESWRGNYKYYSIRNAPSIDFIRPETSIIHPIKSLDSPIRKQQKDLRRIMKKRKFLL